MRGRRRTRKSAFVKIIIAAVIVFAVYLIVKTAGNVLLKNMYPMKYQSIVSDMSKETGLDESFIFAVIKTESNFDSSAVSSAGAKGLMQIMPNTFEWLQTLRDGEIAYDDTSLFDPAVNIKYACFYYVYLKDKYDNDYTAAAAYNAGIGNVDNWLQNKNYSSDGKKLDKIPFAETENYVDKIFSSQNIYKKLYDIK